MVGDSEGEAAGLGSVSVRRRRTPRVTNGQIEALLSILEDRPYLHTRRFIGSLGQDKFEMGWKEVADELNQLPNGSIKTSNQWMTVWRDFKSRACTKAAKLKRERVQTGNRAATAAPLNDVERRILSLIGAEYAFGTDCPDPMPEEVILQQKMEAGGAIEDLISLAQSSRSRTTAVASPPLTEEQNQDTSLHSAASQISVSGSRASTVTPPPSIKQERSRRNRNLKPRRSVAEQENLGRPDFLVVAESHAESIRMLATANQTQADAVKMQAEAAKVQAEAAKLQAEASFLFAQAANKIGDALILFVNKNNV